MKVYLETNLNNITEGEWDALAAQSPTNTVFQTYLWHRSWWETFGGRHQLFLICLKENGRLIGIGPLMLTFKRKWRILKFIGTGQSDYCDFLFPKDRPEVLVEMLTFMNSEKKNWDAAALDSIPEGSPSPAMLRNTLTAQRLYCRRYSQQSCPTLIFDNDRKNVKNILAKKSLKRHHNYFYKKGRYDVLHLTDNLSIQKHLTEFFDQHIKRRSNSRTPSLFHDKANQEFYRTLTANLSSKGWIIFSMIRSEGHAIAFHFGFIYNKRFIWYKPSFDTALSKHSPGEVLLKELLDHALTLPCREFDFTIGDEAFKSRFANKIRGNISLKVFRSKAHLFADRAVTLLKHLAIQ